MNKRLYEMLKSSAEADMAKAKMSLELLGQNPVGIGDHSTEDFYKNAEEALSLLDDASSRLETLNAYVKLMQKENKVTYMTRPKNQI